MKIEHTAGLFILAVLVIILLSAYTAEMLYFARFPAVLPFGLFLIIFLILVTLFIVIAKANSPKLITEKGQFSMNFEKDLIPIPWDAEANEKESKELSQKIGGMDYFLYLTGGINKYGFSIRGRSDSPVVFAPKLYDQKVGCCQINKTILETYDVMELPLNFQYLIKNDYSWRIKPGTTILFGAVSRWDASNTPHNVRELMKQREFNREISFWQDRAIRLYDEQTREKKHKQPDFLVAKGEKVEEYDKE